ncbi:MAG: DsrE/DsrF/DrsH-like family protein [Spirochaetes bacterium]|nr:DsrE/DsrF/DrsH-like family protein [Spirochaetota bacterium]
MAEGKIKKVSIVVSKGSIEGSYPGLIMANGARMEGIEANLFFTFFGLDVIVKNRMGHIGVATVGNPAMYFPPKNGIRIPTLLGMLPGMSAFATWFFKKKMDKLDIPPIPEFVEMAHDAGVKFYACKATVDMFKYTMKDFCPQVEAVITVGDFYEKAAGGEIIFT